jgi:hypothetical protein
VAAAMMMARAGCWLNGCECCSLSFNLSVGCFCVVVVGLFVCIVAGMSCLSDFEGL